jgi:hypothetical protein
MKDPSDVIRDWVYNVLYGTIFYNAVAVPVYSFAPENTVMPYILIAEQSMSGEAESTKDAHITDQAVTIEVYDSFENNDASYVRANTIMSSILETIRTEPLDVTGSGGGSIPAFTGFNAINIIAESMVTDRIQTDTKIIIYKSINLSLLMEEN